MKNDQKSNKKNKKSKSKKLILPNGIAIDNNNPMDSIKIKNMPTKDAYKLSTSSIKDLKNSILTKPKNSK